MDYGRLWSDAPIPPSHPAAHSAAAHHHPNPLHHHHHQQQQTLPLSSNYPDRNPGPSPVAKLHYPFSAASAAPSPADPYVLNPYAPHARYEGLHAPAAAAPSPAEPYVLNPYAPHGGYDGLHVSAAKPYSYPGPGPGATSSPYYDNFGGRGGRGGGDSHGLTAKEAIRLYGMDPQRYGAQTRSSNGLEPAIPSYHYPTQWGDNVTPPISKQTMRKHPKRIIKVAQSAYCEVCKIDCNSPEVLNTHKQGKKHKKNLLKLQEAITARPAKVSSATVGKGMEKETPVADKHKDAGEQRRKRAAPATEEELEMKKKRVLEGGAEATGIKVCTICNVVVNSQQVLECHIAGQRHATMVKKQQSEAGVN